MITSLPIETLLGDDCVCEGRCSECVIGSSDKLCRHCTGYYGTDAKNSHIDALTANRDLLVRHLSCVCPAGYQLTNAGNYVSYSSEVVFVRLECGLRPIDDRFCVGINPQIFFIGSNSDKYWLLMASLPVLLFLCCSVYSVIKIKCCLSPPPFISIHLRGQHFPMTHISVNPTVYCHHSPQPSVDVLSDDTPLPPTYDEVIGSSRQLQTTHPNSHTFIKHLVINQSIEILPTYEDAIANSPPISPLASQSRV